MSWWRHVTTTHQHLSNCIYKHWQGLPPQILHLSVCVCVFGSLTHGWPTLWLLTANTLSVYLLYSEISETQNIVNALRVPAPMPLARNPLSFSKAEGLWVASQPVLMLTCCTKGETVNNVRMRQNRSIHTFFLSTNKKQVKEQKEN